MSRAELAEAVNTWLAERTRRAGAFDAHYMGRLERGQVRWPGQGYRAALRSILRVDSDEALGFRPPRRPGHALQTAMDPVGVLGADDGDRLSSAAAGTLSADRAAVDAVARGLSSVRRLEDQTSASSVLPTVLNQRDVIERLASEMRGPARLTGVGLDSEIHQYLGWLYLPQDDTDEALWHLDRAVQLASEANDPVRLAAALSFQAYAHQQRGDWRRAEELTSAAAQDTRIYPGLRTYLHFQRAEILACQGERRQASQLLVQADRLVARLPQADELPESGYWYVPAFFLGERAFVLDALGETTAARESATACLSELPTEWRDTEWASERRALAERSHEQSSRHHRIQSTYDDLDKY